jgi:hypothetical protein
MKLALLGHGAMGQLVERLAREAGHEVATVLGSREAAFGAEELAEILGGHDAAIDFTVADAVPRHAEACALARVPLVEGTTGWHARLEDVRKVFEREGGALIYGANFSVGVNLFYRVVPRRPHSGDAPRRLRLGGRHGHAHAHGALARGLRLGRARRRELDSREDRRLRVLRDA